MGVLDNLTAPAPRIGGAGFNSTPPLRAGVAAHPTLAPANAYSFGASRSAVDDCPPEILAAQNKIRHYDRHGPSILGATLDIPAALSSLVTWHVEERQGWDWVRTDNPALCAINHGWSGHDCDQVSLDRRIIRTLDGPGDCYLILTQHQSSGQWLWRVAQTPTVTPNRDGTLIIRDRPNAKPGSRFAHHSPAHLAQFVWGEDHQWPGVPWSPMIRALDDLEGFRLARRNIRRNLDSQLAMNGILWSKAIAEDIGWVDAMEAHATRALSEDDSIQAAAPFPMSTPEEPKWVDVGRADHADQLSVADAHLLDFARSSDIATKLLIEGPGAANHWGDFVINDHTADFTMFPRLARLANIKTELHLRTWMRRLPQTKDLDPSKYRVWFGDTAIRSKADQTDRILASSEINRHAKATAMGLTEEDLVELPPGVTEAEWCLLKAGQGLPGQPVEEQEPDVPGDRLRPGVRAENPGEPVRAALNSDSPTWEDLIPA